VWGGVGRLGVGGMGEGSGQRWGKAQRRARSTPRSACAVCRDRVPAPEEERSKWGSPPLPAPPSPPPAGDLLGVADAHQLPVHKDAQPVAQRLSLLHGVGGQHDAAPRLGGLDHVPQVAAGRGVQALRAGGGREGSGRGRAAALAAARPHRRGAVAAVPTLRPAVPGRARVPQTPSSASGAAPAVPENAAGAAPPPPPPPTVEGSSRYTTRGSPTNEMATDSRRFMPPL
jgi:hypothetical protein